MQILIYISNLWFIQSLDEISELKTIGSATTKDQTGDKDTTKISKISHLSLDLPFSITPAGYSSVSSNSSFQSRADFNRLNLSNSESEITCATDAHESKTKPVEALSTRIDSVSNPLVTSSDDPQMSPPSSIETSDFGDETSQNYQLSRSVQGFLLFTI